mmetsp:Transcript_11093/g.41436  ORF Transcript_11093/g.41436 Transcript_11093/m.41436 type:complete len:311 (-) Transcript_11093:262-1194(-)
MRPNRRADEIVRVAHVGHPVPHGLVDGVLQGGTAAFDGNDLRTKLLHPEDIQALAIAVHGAHVDGEIQVEQSADAGAGHAVLPGARLRDDALLPQTLRQKGLAHGVVDLVRARVRELLPLEPDPRTAAFLRQALGQVQRRRAADELPAVEVNLLLEGRVLHGLLVRRLELHVGAQEGLGDVASAKVAKVGVAVGRKGLRVGFAERAALAGDVLLAALLDSRLQRRAELFQVGRVLSQALVQGHRVDDRTADHHAIGDLRHFGDLLGGLDAKANRQRLVGELADAPDEGLQVLCGRASTSGDAGDADAVQE